MNFAEAVALARQSGHNRYCKFAKRARTVVEFQRLNSFPTKVLALWWPAN
jgi:hypothetical protein